MKQAAESWLKQAEEDLRYANEALKDGFYSWVCFACQQAAEKALKSVIVEREGELEKTHRLLRLADLAQKHVMQLTEVRDKLDVLNQYYGATRYADLHSSAAPYEQYDESMAKEAIEYAVEIVGIVKRFLRYG